MGLEACRFWHVVFRLKSLDDSQLVETERPEVYPKVRLDELVYVLYELDWRLSLETGWKYINDWHHGILVFSWLSVG